jgi:tetratricopeptide (TPR) repeat protein
MSKDREEKQINQTSVDLLLKEASVYFEQGLYEEAERCYEDLLKKLETSSISQQIEVRKKLIKEKLKEMEEAWLNYLKQRPISAEVEAQKALIKERIKRLEEGTRKVDMGKKELFIFEKQTKDGEKEVGLCLALSLDKAKEVLKEYGVSESNVRLFWSPYRVELVHFLSTLDKQRLGPIFRAFETDEPIFSIKDQEFITYKKISLLLKDDKIKPSSLVKANSLSLKVYELLMLRAIYVTEVKRLKLPKGVVFSLSEPMIQKGGLATLLKKPIEEKEIKDGYIEIEKTLADKTQIMHPPKVKGRSKTYLLVLAIFLLAIIFYLFNYSSGWYRIIGTTLLSFNKPMEAIALYDKAIEIDPNNVKVLVTKGEILYELARFKEAIALYDKAIEIEPKFKEAWYNKGLALAKLGRYQAALSCFDKAIEIDPNNPDAWESKGLALYKFGKYKEAVTSFDKAIEIDPNNPDAWESKGLALYKLGRYREAVTSFDKAIEIDPNNASAWYNKGLALLRLNRPDEAVVCFNKAKALQK